MAERYSAEDKERAVRMVVEDSRTVTSVARELGIGARSLGGWVKVFRESRLRRSWSDQVANHFGFLARYGFAPAEVDASSFWEVRATYRARFGILAVILSIEDGRVEVLLMRPAADGTPPPLSAGTDVMPVNRCYADDLVALRASHLDTSGQRGLSAQQVESQLAFWSGALREYGQDLLMGDVSVMDDLEEIVRDRVRRHQAAMGQTT